MPSHQETRYLPYPPDKLYALVADIESYPSFLPWCIAARNRKREDREDGEPGEIVWSDLVVGFKMFRERFTSKVTLTPPDDADKARIDVEYVDGPLKYLQNRWIFLPDGNGGCEIDFFVDFEFRNRLFQRIVGGLFQEAVTRMVGAFEARAHALYGEPSRRAAR